MNIQLKAIELGSKNFKKKYNLKYAYLCGGMYHGISSPEMVIKLANSGLMGFFGSGGLKIDKICEKVDEIKKTIPTLQNYGVNFLCAYANTEYEMHLMQRLIKLGVSCIETAAFTEITPALALYRLTNLTVDPNGVVAGNKLIAKISRPEIALKFMSPIPKEMVNYLYTTGLINERIAQLSGEITVADDICVEGDSGGHTDQRPINVILPAIIAIRNKCSKGKAQISVGAAGGIGCPETIASLFLLGADFVMTGSINQCTIEAETSENVKELLQTIGIQDTTYAPAGDMFETGAKVQVVRKGLLFPFRANKLFEIFNRYASLEAIPQDLLLQIEKTILKKSIHDIWMETVSYYKKTNPKVIEKAEVNGRQKMALIFKWYFVNSTRQALSGGVQHSDYQIHCGPALGTFNQYVFGSSMQNWRNRHVDEIGIKLMQDAAVFMQNRICSLGFSYISTPAIFE